MSLAFAAPTSHDALCDRCQRLDLDDFLRGRWTDDEARSGVAFFGKFSAISHDASCALCQALAFIAPSDSDVGQGMYPDTHSLFALPSTLAHRPVHRPSTDGFGDHVLGRLKARGDSVWLSIRKQHTYMIPFFLIDMPRSTSRYGCLAEYSSDFDTAGLRVRFIDPEKADIDAIRQWLNICANSHGGACSTATATKPSLPRGFVVIDCQTRKLQSLPAGAKFAALSYVWGAPVPNANYSLSSAGFTPLPQTIEDAMAMAVDLGIGFIWVDRYCVPQQECNEKREQIQKMHDIYGAADVTIIAAAGENPEYGLPGVSRPRGRPPAANIQIGSTESGRRLISGGRGVEEAIRKTTWATRAWTFQEGLISTRKLIFTDEQVYFHCAHREYREAIQEDHSAVANKTSSCEDLLGTPFRCSYLHSGLDEKRIDQLYYILQDFSERKIRFESDFLNAATGILNMYEQAFPDSLRHVWGQPLMYGPRCTLGDMMASGLRWELQLGAKRRPEMPSWSWMGWHGCMKGPPGLDETWQDGESEVSIQLLLQDGSTVEDAECQALMANPLGLQKLSGKLSKCISIEAETVYLRIHHRGPSNKTSDYQWEPTFGDAAGTMDLGPMTDANGFIATQEVKNGDQLHGKLCAGLVWLGLVFPRADFILVLKDMGPHYERIGVVRYYAPVEGQRLTDMCVGRRKVTVG